MVSGGTRTRFLKAPKKELQNIQNGKYKIPEIRKVINHYKKKEKGGFRKAINNKSFIVYYNKIMNYAKYLKKIDMWKLNKIRLKPKEVKFPGNRPKKITRWDRLKKSRRYRKSRRKHNNVKTKKFK